jgi:hypothetical protein
MAEEFPPTLIALVLPSLVPEAPHPPTPRDREITAIAKDLQITGSTPDLTSMMVMVHLGVEWVDRISEIFGRTGSAGEQLGLALASVRDGRRWMEPEASDQDPQYATMGARAQAEMTAMWTLGAAHGLANALIRLLLLNTDARKVVDDAYPEAEGFPPLSEKQSAWVSFDPKAMRTARKAAAASQSPAAIAAAKALSSVFGDNRWNDFLDLRNVGFHRWRPQSVDGGTPKASSVTRSDSSYSITVGVGASNVAPDKQSVLKVAVDGLDLFATAAMAFDNHVHAAVNELSGKELFQVRANTEGGIQK